jgi:endonuclease I
MRPFLLPLAALLAVTASAQTTCTGDPDGWRLRACLRAAHAPDTLLDAGDAFQLLVEAVDVRVRHDSTFVTDSTFVETDSSWHAEEWWDVETVRYVLDLGSSEKTAPDADAALATGWTAHPAEPTVTTPALHVVGTPLPSDALPPPAGARLDLHAAWPSRSTGVADSARGDVARGALYVRMVYPTHVEAGREAQGTLWPASGVALSADLPTLLAWHAEDPPDDAERERHDRAAAVQGNRNPYVDDPALVDRSFPKRPPSSAPRPASALWINEVHATNDGRDAGEGVEVVGPARSDLLGHRIVFYGGRGAPYDPYDETVSAAPLLAGALPSEGALGTAWLPARGLWNRCNGVALVDPDGRLAHFLSYGGCQFNATSGPVFDLAALDGAADPAHPNSLVWSEPAWGLGPRAEQEWLQMPAGRSLQLAGAGARLADFAWTLSDASPGRLNDHQAPATSAAAIPRRTDEPLYPDLAGAALLRAIDADFSPARTLPYDRARDSLLALSARLSPSGDSIRTLYADRALFLPPGADPTSVACDGDGDGDNRTCSGALNVNAEHVWPQSYGADAGDARSDGHHLFPARADVNSSRGNRPFGTVTAAQGDRWWRGTDRRETPPADPERWATVELDGPGVDGDRFSPPADKRGDVARALFYVATVYPDRTDATARTWFEGQRDVLLAWHEADPPDDREASRSVAVAAWQGSENPFVLDPTLAPRAFGDVAPTSQAERPGPAFSLGPPVPNPTTGTVRFVLTTPHPTAVRAVVVDALGREVAIAFDGTATTRTEVRVDTTRLAPGAYLLRVVARDAASPDESHALSRRFTVVR